MLILRRWPGQDVIVTDILGNTLTIRVLEPRRGAHPRDVELGFTDRDRNFRIERPERRPVPVDGHDVQRWDAAGKSTPLADMERLKKCLDDPDRKYWPEPVISSPTLKYDPPPWTERGEGDASTVNPLAPAEPFAKIVEGYP